MTALLAGLGFAFDYTGESWLDISSGGWGLIGLIAFGVFVAITIGREIDIAFQQRPNVMVRPEVRNNRAILVVKNIGAEADFTAKARVIASNPEAELYTMYWESVPGTSCHIDGDGGIATILVGEKAKYDNKTMEVEPFFMKGDLVLFKMGTTGEQTFPVFAREGEVVIKDGREIKSSGTQIPRCITEVTITSTPRLKKRWGTNKYLLEIENGDIRFGETNLSNPHKVAYLTE